MLFSASTCLHEVLPFVGRRLVLVAYTLQAVDAAPAPLLSSLLGLGFRTPPTGVAAAAVICPPRMLPWRIAREPCFLRCRRLLIRVQRTLSPKPGHGDCTGIIPCEAS